MELTGIIIAGWGAVSPAGWGAEALRSLWSPGTHVPAGALPRPGRAPLSVHAVPPPPARPEFFAHPRLRRVGALTQHLASAIHEAVRPCGGFQLTDTSRLGLIVCLQAGNTNYSRRFLEEVAVNPLTASPLLFPETVLNASASHVAALFTRPPTAATMIGEAGAFLQAIAVAADWINTERVDGCLVAAAEEIDWVLADALALFDPSIPLAAGAGALFLTRPRSDRVRSVWLECVTDSFVFHSSQTRMSAAQQMRHQLPSGAPDELLCDSTRGRTRYDAAEDHAWRAWPGLRLSPKHVLGEALSASSAWQCVLAADSLASGRARAANISVLGPHHQAIGARFICPAQHEP